MKQWWVSGSGGGLVTVVDWWKGGGVRERKIKKWLKISVFIIVINGIYFLYQYLTENINSR